MIIEGVITTTNARGELNVAPMGPVLLAEDFSALLLRPFRTSRTYRNLKEVPEGVFHVTDDVELIARAVLGDVAPRTRPAEAVRGRVLEDACRYYEFRIEDFDDREERTALRARTVASGRFRDFLGFNRARHAVVEAAIAVSRLGILPRVEIEAELARLHVLVAKTGGDVERRAFGFLRDHVAADARRHAPPRRVTVRTGSRLHLGLLAPSPCGPRRFGGVGIMVERPGLEVCASPAPALSVHGEMAGRADAVARAFLERCGGVDGAEIEVRCEGREHRGLGVGTQLSLAIARALAELVGRGHTPVAELAAITGRGERSGIGVHGFERGGILVDGGHAANAAAADVAPLVARHELPSAWRLVLAAPRGHSLGLSGRRERAAFETLARDGALERARELGGAVCSELLLALLPAACEADFDAFSAAVWELGRKVGESFKPAQGGVFASPEVARLVEAIRAAGVEGVAQSSWGPTVFAVVEDEDRARHLAAGLESTLPVDVVVTSARNRGAEVEVAL